MGDYGEWSIFCNQSMGDSLGKMLTKMKRYKPIFEEKQKLIEIALVGKTKGLEIRVYTDIEPMHFYVAKKDIYEARIKIPKELPSTISELEILNYKFQKSEKDIVTNQDLKLLQSWMGERNKNRPEITNFQATCFLWDSLNQK